MVTADTITDEQIRDMLSDEDIYVRHTASVALYCDQDSERRKERGRCADIVNARTR